MGRGELVALALLLGAYLILAAAYGLATPDLEAPDAGAHFRYVAFLHDHPQLPAYDLPTALVSHELVQQPPLYYALVAALLPGADVQATVAYEQAVQTPYFEKGLGKRATVSPPDADPRVLWPLRVARGVSLAGGLLMVVATWLLARSLFKGRIGLPLAIAAIVAFNPEFLFSSTTITNDIWAAALSTVAVSVAAAAAARNARLPAWLLVGALCGLATITKYSGVITLLPVALLALLLRPAWNLPQPGVDNGGGEGSAGKRAGGGRRIPRNHRCPVCAQCHHNRRVVPYAANSHAAAGADTARSVESWGALGAAGVSDAHLYRHFWLRRAGVGRLLRAGRPGAVVGAGGISYRARHVGGAAQTRRAAATLRVRWRCHSCGVRRLWAASAYGSAS